MSRSFTISGFVAILLLLLFAMPVSATTVPCDRSRRVSKVVPLPDGTFGTTWTRSYGTTQVSYRWNGPKLVVKVGATRVSQPLKSFWIREAFYVCSAGKLKKTGRAYRYYVSGSELPISQKPLRIDVWRYPWLQRQARDGFWMVGKITIETFNGKRTSVRAMLPILPPERL